MVKDTTCYKWETYVFQQCNDCAISPDAVEAPVLVGKSLPGAGLRLDARPPSRLFWSGTGYAHTLRYETRRRGHVIGCRGSNGSVGSVEFLVIHMRSHL